MIAKSNASSSKEMTIHQSIFMRFPVLVKAVWRYSIRGNKKPLRPLYFQGFMLYSSGIGRSISILNISIKIYLNKSAGPVPENAHKLGFKSQLQLFD